MTMIHTLSETSPAAPETLPLVENGDLLSQAEFHHRYGLMPETFRADLIGGVVFASSSLHHRHSKNRILLGTPVFLYEGCTPGVQASERATVILSDQDELHPDLCVRLLSECGGQSRVSEDEDIFGAPELSVEVAASARSLEFHLKLERYRAAGVIEYLVLCLEEWKLYWFNLQLNREMQPDTDGVFRSRVFPGLWIDGPALLDRQPAKLLETLDHGLASPAYSNFRNRLAKFLAKASGETA
jgi:hypothetical protein